ncbi:chromate transporter [Roseibium hamelinense]|uniref:Chromate transporter n=1 Tax=Roseibium hamelinense TaxID=150831 RepID=A0A562SNT1_9HYPH|nr:chromate efflux transporter [Roseibium hamelinense]MTI45082.1 chromate efflux transporter [Roseibium hamelinense]TWI82346.1 chromate transporter [Roseibium hamelinense]
MPTPKHPDNCFPEPASDIETPTLAEVAKVSLKVGVLSFGGPAAQISMMHQEFVDNRRWLSEERFLHALNYCMLLPGPEAQQLATYCGWIAARTWGGLISGLLFILPGAFAMAMVSWVYTQFGNVGLIDAVFYGVKAGVLAIVLQALAKVAQKALKSKLAWGVAALSFLALFFLSVPFPVVILAAGIAGILFARNHPQPIEAYPAKLPRIASTAVTLAIGLLAWAAPAALATIVLSPEHVLVDVARFFSTLAAVSFGGAYALLSYMAQVAVETKGWLTAGQMLDGLGLAETTPGPLILVTQFVGFQAGWTHPGELNPLTVGLLAAAMTTWVTFVPSFLLVLAGAPWIEKLRGNSKLNAALSGITAAVTGTILNLAVWFAINVLFADIRELEIGPLDVTYPIPQSLDIGMAAIACIAGVLVFTAKRGIATVVLTTACLGLAVRALTTGI